jgi:hypothetical protein
LIRRRTISELRYLTPANSKVAATWSKDFSTNLLGHVWRAYDRLREEVLSRIDVSEASDDLERNITELLEHRIERLMTGDEPFYVQHSTAERETRLPAPAQPPTYDIAFTLRSNERLKWPLEAKILDGDSSGSVAEYVRDIREEFLTCRYAPFSSEGAMLGYLVGGDADKAFESIAMRVPCELVRHPDFEDRKHRMSDHRRTVPPDRRDVFPEDFRCHHLILQMST